MCNAVVLAAAGPLHGDAFEQATLAIFDGGLRAERAIGCVLLTLLATRAAARPFVVRRPRGVEEYKYVQAAAFAAA